MIPIKHRKKTKKLASSTKKKVKKIKTRWLTPTSINTFIRCPRRYYYTRIARLRQPPNIHLIRGSAVHKTIEQFYDFKINQCKNYDFIDLKLVIYNLFKQNWKAYEKTFDRINLTHSDQEFYFYDALKKNLYNFVENFYFNKEFEKPSPIIEKMLISKKLKLRGRVDAIYNNPRGPPAIIDFKTSKSKEMKPDYIRQLGIYALLYFENYKLIPDVGIHFLNFKDGPQKFTVSASLLESTRKLVADIHNKIKSNNIADYPCVCGWCDKAYNKIG